MPSEAPQQRGSRSHRHGGAVTPLQLLSRRSSGASDASAAASPRAKLQEVSAQLTAGSVGSLSALSLASSFDADSTRAVDGLSSRRLSMESVAEPDMEDALKGKIASLMGLSAAQAPDVAARLARNTAVLLQKGIDTPEKLQTFLSQAWRHDAILSFAGMGLADGGGYFAGMTAANEKLVAMLPLALLKNPSLLGLALGVGVGAVDVFASVVGGAIVKPKIYNDYGGNLQLPPSLRAEPAAELLKNAGISAGVNVAKNLPRIAEPFIQAAVEGRGDHSVDRLWADRIDASFIDGGLGMVAAGAKNVMKLSQTVPYDARMLLREDLPEVIDKTRASWGDSFKAIGPAALQGAKSLVTSPVPVAVVATVGLFVSELFAANANIDLTGSPASLAPDRADAHMLAQKRASSVMLFGVMSGLIEIGVPYVAQGGAYTAQKIRQAWQQAPNVMTWAQSRLGPAAHEPQSHDLELGHGTRPLH
ncbi:hypothetical protein AVHM3334_20215 [Acidovorax sp. SUPP3334]|nr:hypothetical protein AVHM3334_20215 [Acidovorax sp. SUPP3334]